MDNDQGNQRDRIKFHCSKTGELITTDDCFDCPTKMSCDMHATMLDEEGHS